jgi:hypothetical protein
MCAKRLRKGTKLNQGNLSDAKDRIIRIKMLEGMAHSTINQYNIVFNDLIFSNELKSINLVVTSK